MPQNKEYQPKSLYRGKPLDEYSKEQLIEIIEGMGLRIKEMNDQHRRDLDLLR